MGNLYFLEALSPFSLSWVRTVFPFLLEFAFERPVRRSRWGKETFFPENGRCGATPAPRKACLGFPEWANEQYFFGRRAETGLPYPPRREFAVFSFFPCPSSAESVPAALAIFPPALGVG